MTTSSPRRERVFRRLRTIPLVFAAFALLAVAVPLLLPIAVLIDLGRWLTRRRPWMTVRLLLFAFAYLLAEVTGVVRLALIWLTTGGGRSRDRFLDRTYEIQLSWATFLLGTARRLFGLSFHVEGLEAVQPGPILLLARHASIVDNLLPAVYVTGEGGIRLRYILKKELLVDPCLDIAGTRLPNYFVDREAADPRKELEQIRQLASDLSPTDGVLIFPEGTRFTPARFARAVEKLEAAGSSLAERARSFRHVMPPKVGGVTALLKAASGVDVVFLAHRGLEGFARLSDVWRGALVGRRIEVRLWRVPADKIPTDRKGRADWLFAQWAQIDEWVGAAARSHA